MIILNCSVLHLFECYDTMAKRFKVKMGFCESEKGFLGYKGFRGSIVRVLPFCDFAKTGYATALGCGPWVLYHSFSVCVQIF